MAYINLLSLWMRRQNTSGMDVEVLCNSALVTSRTSGLPVYNG